MGLQNPDHRFESGRRLSRTNRSRLNERELFFCVGQPAINVSQHFARANMFELNMEQARMSRGQKNGPRRLLRWGPRKDYLGPRGITLAGQAAHLAQAPGRSADAGLYQPAQEVLRRLARTLAAATHWM